MFLILKGDERNTHVFFVILSLLGSVYLFWGEGNVGHLLYCFHLKLRWVDLISKTMSTYGDAMRCRASRVLDLLQEISAKKGLLFTDAWQGCSDVH